MLDLVIMDASLGAQLQLLAFQGYWAVETDVVKGATAWPAEALMQIHTTMKALPSQDTRAGVWTRLSLTADADLTNRAAWNGSDFIVGESAAQRAASETTDVATAAAIGDTTINVVNGAAFTSPPQNVSIGSASNRELVQISSIAANVYTLSRPLLNAHAVGEKLISTNSAYGHGTALTAAAAIGATTLSVTEGPRFAVGDTIALDRLGPKRDVAKITAIAGNQYTIDTALTNAHPSGVAVTPRRQHGSAKRELVGSNCSPRDCSRCRDRHGGSDCIHPGPRWLVDPQDRL